MDEFELYDNDEHFFLGSSWDESTFGVAEQPIVPDWNERVLWAQNIMEVLND